MKLDSSPGPSHLVSGLAEQKAAPIILAAALDLPLMNLDGLGSRLLQWNNKPRQLRHHPNRLARWHANKRPVALHRLAA